MLQQQQQHMLQSKASMGSNMQLLQAVLNRGDAGADCSGQGAMNDVIGMMMQQLVLQQRPSVL
jgi:hypothetical protein